MKQLFIYIITLLVFGGIFYNFWRTEWKYLTPTPIPQNYQEIQSGTQILLDTTVFKTNKPIFLHFFSPDCPCSKYNIEYLQQLVAKNNQQVNFYAILFAEDTVGARQYFQEKYNLKIPVIIKNGNLIAASCGVYSTPQAAIIGNNLTLFFRGNYNKSRYCTDKQTNFAEIALSNLLNNKMCPDFGEAATRAYGCELPDNYYETLPKDTR
jgi:peroxiredoxin